MARKKAQPEVQEERWVTAKEATAILNENSGRKDIEVSYVRTLAAQGKVQKREEGLDGRTALYRLSDIEHRKVRQHQNLDTVAARKAGSRNKKRPEGVSEQVS